jgi:hypothetical protein
VWEDVAAHLEKSGIGPPSGSMPVAFHVVCARSENPRQLEGHVPGRQSQNDIGVLTSASEGAGFELFLAHCEHVENSMDYTDDACMVELTPSQDRRMREMVPVYEPGLQRPGGGSFF